MMKYSILLFLGLIISSCKYEKTSTHVEDITPTKVLSDQELISQLYQHYYHEVNSSAQKEQNTIIDYAVEQNLPLQKTLTGLFYHIERTGTGALLRYGDRAEAHYKGYFLNGEVFDSSYDRNRPIQFKVGQMISGWNEAMYMATSGTKMTIVVPSRLAYGPEGLEGEIPPNTILAFDIEVLSNN